MNDYDQRYKAIQLKTRREKEAQRRKDYYQKNKEKVKAHQRAKYRENKLKNLQIKIAEIQLNKSDKQIIEII